MIWVFSFCLDGMVRLNELDSKIYELGLGPLTVTMIMKLQNSKNCEVSLWPEIFNSKCFLLFDFEWLYQWNVNIRAMYQNRFIFFENDVYSIDDYDRLWWLWILDYASVLGYYLSSLYYLNSSFLFVMEEGKFLLPKFAELSFIIIF